MKIETVSWTWADNVSNKAVYRDEEFVRTQSKEEAILAIDFLMAKNTGLTYTITVFRDGEYFTYFRHSMPCYGGLVKYKDSHGDKYFMNPYFPRDIRVAFPEGEIVFIACYILNIEKSVNNIPYVKFLFSEESPWASAFGKYEDVIFKQNYFILTNMNTDPTVLYSLLRLGRLSYKIDHSKYHPKAEILVNSKYTRLKLTI